MRPMLTTATVILLAGTAMAAAADLAGKAPAPPDWSGFYVGATGGYGNGNLGTLKAGTKGNSIVGPATGHSVISQSGYLSGGFVGVQKQRGNVVLGIEADIGPSGLSGSSNSSSGMLPRSISR